MQIIFASILVFVAALAAANIFPDSGLTGILGFAEKGGTTGGSNGSVVHISNLWELQQHIRDTEPQKLVITTDIVAPQKTIINMGANKSLIGSWKANTIDNVYLQTSNISSNIILQNLVFKHNVQNVDNSETQVIFQFGDRYWVDHCTFDGQKIDKNDLGKLLKVSEKVDYVTISNSKFLNHMYGIILGYPSDDPSGIAIYDNFPRISIMFNYFDNIYVRAPGLMRFGIFHVYNNYINNYHLGFTISFQSKIFSEYNYFSTPGIKNAVIDDKGNGYFKDVGSTNMPKNQVSKNNTWYQSSDYNYKVKTPEYSRDFCVKFSGAQRGQLVFGGS